MKKTLFLTIALIFFLSFNTTAQVNKDKLPITITKYSLTDSAIKESEKTNSDLIAVKTPKGDTLFLINNEIGKSIEDIWQNNEKFKTKPVIMYVSYNVLKEKMIFYSRKK